MNRWAKCLIWLSLKLLPATIIAPSSKTYLNLPGCMLWRQLVRNPDVPVRDPSCHHELPSENSRWLPTRNLLSTENTQTDNSDMKCCVRTAARMWGKLVRENLAAKIRTCVNSFANGRPLILTQPFACSWGEGGRLGNSSIVLRVTWKTIDLWPVTEVGSLLARSIHSWDLPINPPLETKVSSCEPTDLETNISISIFISAAFRGQWLRSRYVTLYFEKISIMTSQSSPWDFFPANAFFWDSPSVECLRQNCSWQ